MFRYICLLYIKFATFNVCSSKSLLLIICLGGGLSVKILKRTAKFENQDYSNTVRDLQNTKLNLPKKTKLFVDQTMREREHSISMTY